MTPTPLTSAADRVAPAPAASAAAIAAAGHVAGAPEAYSRRLRSLIAQRHGVGDDCVTVGPGSASLIHGVIARAAAGAGGNAVMSQPSFPAYRILCGHYGLEPRTAALRDYRHDLDAIADLIDQETRLVLLDSPHGITGTACQVERVVHLSTLLPAGGIVLYDNAYGEFDPTSEVDGIVGRTALSESRVLVSKTFSKAHGLFGARVGYVLGARDVLAAHGPLVQKYDVHTVGQAMAEAAYRDTDWTARNVAVAAQTRTGIYQVCQRHAVPHVQSRSNSVLADLADRSGAVARRLRALGCTVRDETSHGIEGHLQILVTDCAVIDHLATALQEELPL